MGIFDNLKQIFSSTPGDPNAIWLYVRCARCGMPLAVRVDLRNELSADYEQGGYVLVKEMMDSKCFTLMRAQVRFNQQRNMTEHQVEGGTWMTRDEYEAMTNEQMKKDK